MNALALEERTADREASPMRVATIRRTVRETPDTTTLWLTLTDPAERASYRFRPGQFNMLSVFGVAMLAESLEVASLVTV